MKKFFTFIALQPKGQLHEVEYRTSGNEHLRVPFPIHYPVIAMMNGYVEKEEHIKLYTIGDSENGNYEHNLSLLRQDLERIKQDKPFACEMIPVNISGKEYAIDHLETFSKILDVIDDGDDLYVCVTYGTKPTPIIEMMVLNAAGTLKKDVSVACVVYGGMNHVTKEVMIYDITALFHMMQIVSDLKDQEIEDPLSVIRALVDPGEQGDE